MSYDFKEGDVGLGFFEYVEGREATDVAHPMLVLEVRSGIGCVVAYGTSQMTGQPLETEVDLTLDEAKKLGLNRPTRFMLTRRSCVLNDLCSPVWVAKKKHISVAGEAAMLKFFKAAKAAGLLDA